MSKGFATIAYAKSVVVVETGRLTEDQFDRLRHVLSETFGSVMVNQLPDKKLEVMWYSSTTPTQLFSRGKQMTPERMREIISEQLEAYEEAIGYEFVKPRD